MDLIDQLRALAARVTTSKDLIQTEEATKNAMIMPFKFLDITSLILRKSHQN